MQKLLNPYLQDVIAENVAEWSVSPLIWRQASSASYVPEPWLTITIMSNGQNQIRILLLVLSSIQIDITLRDHPTSTIYRVLYND